MPIHMRIRILLQVLHMLENQEKTIYFYSQQRQLSKFFHEWQNIFNGILQFFETKSLKYL